MRADRQLCQQRFGFARAVSLVLVIVGTAFSAADVNPKTLNFFLPVDVLTVSDYQSIEIKAAYNSYDVDKSIFGSKWSFNQSVHIEPKGWYFSVVEGDGYGNSYYPVRNFDLARKVLNAKRNLGERVLGELEWNGSLNQVEGMMRGLSASDSSRESAETAVLGKFSPPAGTYYSLSRGPSQLIVKPDHACVRTFQNGSFETFNPSGTLASQSDRNGNTVTYEYDGGRLTKIKAANGGFVAFRYSGDSSFVSSVSDSVGRTVSFSHDAAGRWVGTTDTAGSKTSSSYDERGNMTEIVIVPLSGKTTRTTVSYNEKGEVTGFDAHDGTRTAFNRRFINGEEGHTVTELRRYSADKLTSTEVQEYEIRKREQTTTYGPTGAMLSQETKTLNPDTGYPESIIDKDGKGDRYEYDLKTGDILKREAVPGGAVDVFDYDPAARQVNRIRHYTRGSLRSTESFTFDARHNLNHAEEVDENTHRTLWSIAVAYTERGKIAELRDEVNARTIRFTYNLSLGKPDSILLADSGKLSVKYSPAGEILKVDTTPDGAAVERFRLVEANSMQTTVLAEVKGALEETMGHLKPVGLNIGF